MKRGEPGFKDSGSCLEKFFNDFLFMGKVTDFIVINRVFCWMERKKRIRARLNLIP
jgi:hypothetical protein